MCIHSILLKPNFNLLYILSLKINREVLDLTGSKLQEENFHVLTGYSYCTTLSASLLLVLFELTC